MYQKYFHNLNGYPIRNLFHMKFLNKICVNEKKVITVVFWTIGEIDTWISCSMNGFLTAAFLMYYLLKETIWSLLTTAKANLSTGLF